MLFLIVSAFFCTNLASMAVLLMLILLMSVFARQKLSIFKNAALIISVVAVQLLLLQLLFCRQGDITSSWWIFDIYSQAVPLAFRGTLRTAIIVLSVMQFTAWTSPTDLQLLLMKFHVPYRYASLAALGLRFMPAMEDEYHAITESQKARGVKIDSVLDRIKALPAVAMPLLYRSMRWSQNAALAMELRGFGKYDSHVFLKDLRLRWWDILASIVLTSLLILIAISKVI